MKVNPTKLQAISFDKKGTRDITVFTYFICFNALTSNILYAFYVLCLIALHLFVGKDLR